MIVRSILLAVLAFVMMEFVAYAAHRFVYHGFLWVIHRSHHTPREGVFELNDLFPLFFAGVTVALLLYGMGDPVRADLVAVSIGITLYGMIYFFIHDLYVHRRIKALPLRIPLLLTIKKAHAVHHRGGGEPYGLLFFADPDRVRREQLQEDDAV